MGGVTGTAGLAERPLSIGLVIPGVAVILGGTITVVGVEVGKDFGKGAT